MTAERPEATGRVPVGELRDLADEMDRYNHTSVDRFASQLCGIIERYE